MDAPKRGRPVPHQGNSLFLLVHDSDIKELLKEDNSTTVCPKIELTIVQKKNIEYNRMLAMAGLALAIATSELILLNKGESSVTFLVAFTYNGCFEALALTVSTTFINTPNKLYWRMSCPQISTHHSLVLNLWMANSPLGTTCLLLTTENKNLSMGTLPGAFTELVNATYISESKQARILLINPALALSYPCRI